MNLRSHLTAGDGLIIVDVQNDFCPGGRLPVAEGDRIVPLINSFIEAAVGKEVPIYASRDWHPKRHVSFKEQGGDWPPHCLQDSPGAAFHPDLKLPVDVAKITKGVRFDKDQKSAFDQTGLVQRLRRDRVHRLWIGGLAQDVCVLETVLDGKKAGFDVILIEDATRPVSAEKGRAALARIKTSGPRYSGSSIADSSMIGNFSR
jgi:nicotinamidase/pyrazinamidase